MIYIPVSSQTRQLIPFKIAQTELELQDHDSIMLDEVTKLEMSGLFRLV